MENKILAKVRALLEKTVAAGCTESEALAAAEKAAELLDKYGLELASLEDAGAGNGKPVYLTRKFLFRTCVNYFAMPLASYTGVKVFKSDKHLVVFGKEENILFFEYLGKSLGTLCANSLNAARAAAENPSDIKPRDFWLGFGTRINALVAARMAERKANQSTGTALVVSEQELTEAFEEANPNLRQRKQVKVGKATAFHAGHAAGGAANLSRPLGAGRCDRQSILGTNNP